MDELENMLINSNKQIELFQFHSFRSMLGKILIFREANPVNEISVLLKFLIFR